MGGWDVCILGPLEVVRDTRPVALPRGRGRALLALLALQAGRVVAADRLIDELWGDVPPPTANKGLHNLIADLRRRLGDRDDEERPGVLETSGPGYALRIDSDEVDANRFRRLVEEAAGAPASERVSRLRSALELWRGPPLADFSYEPFAQAEIAVLEELRLTAIEERIDADLALGRHAELVGELEGLVAAHPYRERLLGQLMLALYRSARQADALAAYQQRRRALVEDLGIEPGPAVAALEQAILRQDASLDLPPDTAPRHASAIEQRIDTKPWLAAERKTVTVVHAELADTAAGSETADPEVSRRLLARCVDAAKAACERHGGTVEGFIGGVLVAVFGSPIAHEDDALRAVRAAVELREAVAGLARESARVAARAGVNTGEIVVAQTGEDAGAASGDAVTLAARLQQAAAEGEVLIGETTRRLLGDAATVESVSTLVLDRRGRPATVWRLAGLTATGPVRTAAQEQPLVGRAHELTRLHGALQRTVRNSRAGRCAVIGEAGVGKSRLALEFVDTLAAEARALVGHCPAYGEGITFWPLREIALQAAGKPRREAIAALLAGDDAEDVAGHIAGTIGLDEERGSGKELFPAVRRLCETLAGRQPLVLVIDDAHWAQPTFLDLLDYLAESVRAPLLIVCLARPELRDKRPGWVDEQGDATAFMLEPLSPAHSERLVTDRLAGRLVPDDLVTTVVEMAEGNPLFIEQLLAALRDEGKLRVPPSVQALLAARLDRLGPAERDLLRCASVIGTAFPLEGLAALVPEAVRRFLDRHLDALRRKELIRRADPPFIKGQAFAFRHVLIQQAAYRSTTREARAELHERFADWLEQQEAPELEEIIAYHLEQAHDQRRQLALIDEATDKLALRAGERLARAGLLAYRRFDVAGAENLLARARALLPADHPQRREVLRRLAEAYPMLGRLGEAEAVVTEMLEDLAGAGPASRPGERRLRLERLRIRMIAGPDPVPQDTIRRETQQALTALEAAGDDLGISQACYVLAMISLRSGHMGELAAIAERGLAHAQSSGDVRERTGAPWFVSWALVAGPTPVPDALRSCEELLQATRGEHVGVRSDLARLKAMHGEVDAARRLAARARRDALERFRVRRALTVLSHRSAEVELLAGDLDAAERILRQAIEVALDVAEQDQTSQIAADLSRVLAACGSTTDAARYATLAREQAPAESVTAQALWRAARACVLAARDRADQAAGLVREALGLVARDMLNLRADLHVELARPLSAAGQREAARSAIDEAVRLYDGKGNVAGARQANATTRR